MFSSEYNSVIFSKMYWVGGGKYENVKNSTKKKNSFELYICLMDFYWY